MEDPRPLTGEPLSLDLLNTVWRHAAGRHDLLDNLEGQDIWLRARGLSAPTPDATRGSLLDARQAIAGHVADPTHPGSAHHLNAVLRRGSIRRVLTQNGPEDVVSVDAPEHLLSWLAADDYLRLLTRGSDRIRRCAHPECVLHFYDTSPKGNRRWCSMAGCGNRAKAARHYQRTKRG